jgi:hypothetical protein
MELLDPIDGHDHAKALLHFLALDRGKRSGSQVAVDPNPWGGVALDVKIRAANLCHMGEDRLQIEHEMTIGRPPEEVEPEKGPPGGL